MVTLVSFSHCPLRSSFVYSNDPSALSAKIDDPEAAWRAAFLAMSFEPSAPLGRRVDPASTESRMGKEAASRLRAVVRACPAECELEDEDGSTLLHLACRDRRLECLRALVELGYSRGRVDARGRTAWAICHASGFVDGV
jgi:hypothetical protein